MNKEEIVNRAREEIRQSIIGYRTYFISTRGIDGQVYGSYQQVRESFLDNENYSCSIVDGAPSFMLLDFRHVPNHSHYELAKELMIQNNRGLINITYKRVIDILNKHGIQI